MKLAGQTNPTLCDFVSEMEVLMTEWEYMAIQSPETAPAIAKGLAKIVEYYKKMDKCTAYVISMCEFFLCAVKNLTHGTVVLNPAYRFQWIQQNWGEPYASDAKDLILDTVSFCLLNSLIFGRCLIN